MNCIILIVALVIEVVDWLVLVVVIIFHRRLFSILIFRANPFAFYSVNLSAVDDFWVQMRTVSMCFSSFSQVPRCRIYNLAHFWSERFHNLSRTCGYNSSSKLYDSKIYVLDGGNSRKWTRRSVTTNTQGRNKSGQCSDPRKLRQEILDVTVSTSATLNLNKIEDRKSVV